MKKIVLTLAVLAALPVLCSGALKKSVTWENIKAHPAPLPVLGELVPVASQLDAPSFWSVGSETLDRDFADFEQYKQYMGETGVGYSRLQSGWAKTEKKKGKYDFAWLDAQVDGLLAEGIHPWICLCYGNPIYSDHGIDLGAKLFPEGPVMDAWVRYVKACVKRYKEKVTMWEVWNEPDGSKKLDSYPEYAELFLNTAKAIREVDLDAKIAAVGACTPDRKYIRQVMEIIRDAGRLDLVDYVTYHAYWPTPERVAPAVEELRKDMKAFSPHIGILQGETGCPAQLEYGHAMNSIEWTEYSQAKWDLRQSLTHFGLGVPYSFFTMVDLNYGWMLQSFGLIRMNGRKEPVYKRPKFYAVQHVTSLFTPELKSAEMHVECNVDKELKVVGIEKEGKKIGCILWFCGERPGNSLERKLVDIRIKDLDIEDPVYVDMLTGNVHDLSGIIVKNKREVGSLGFNGLPLWDSPVVVIDRSAVRF